jgi:hypothetical protein
MIGHPVFEGSVDDKAFGWREDRSVERADIVIGVNANVFAPSTLESALVLVIVEA